MTHDQTSGVWTCGRRKSIPFFLVNLAFFSFSYIDFCIFCRLAAAASRAKLDLQSFRRFGRKSAFGRLAAAASREI